MKRLKQGGLRRESGPEFRAIPEKSLVSRLKAFRVEDGGQSSVIIAVCLGGLLLFLGLVFDTGNMRVTKVRLQSAADAAAVAQSL